ncbi:MAG: type II toxin-antitoxin system RelE/ParE family toxin [Capsulimonadaceae bacterium]|nr:type II toxin-antitoxin system RelE/ParE family toxin [Capsulimonadaceae bacterium]
MFRNKSFTRFARKAGIADVSLLREIEDAEKGLIDAGSGGGVIKQRIARPGKGKSKVFRTVILFRERDRAIFVHGFAKSDIANISDDELAASKMLAAALLNYDDASIARASETGVLLEVVADE